MNSGLALPFEQVREAEGSFDDLLKPIEGLHDFLGRHDVKVRLSVF